MINFNIGLSTPVALTIILVLAILAGGGILGYQYWIGELPLPEKTVVFKEYKISCRQDNDCVGTCSQECVGKDNAPSEEPPCYMKPSCECINNQCVRKLPEGAGEETSGWKTYKNDKYAFEVQYPKDFKLKMVDQGVKVVFPDSYKSSSYIFKNDVTDAWIGIGVGIMAKEGIMGELCQKLEKLSDEEVKINNLNFIRGNIRSNAMGGWYTDYNIYRVSHNGMCYEISLAVTGQGPGAGANDGAGPLPQDYAGSDSKEKFISILNQLIYSFKFTD